MTIVRLSLFLPVALFLVSAPAVSGQVKSEDEAIRLVLSAVHKFHLTTLKDECIATESVEGSKRFEIVVREHHTQSCGGDPETEPRLFSVRVRKSDGLLSSDVYDGVSYKPVDREFTTK